MQQILISCSTRAHTHTRARTHARTHTDTQAQSYRAGNQRASHGLAINRIVLTLACDQMNENEMREIPFMPLQWCTHGAELQLQYLAFKSRGSIVWNVFIYHHLFLSKFVLKRTKSSRPAATTCSSTGARNTDSVVSSSGGGTTRRRPMSQFSGCFCWWDAFFYARFYAPVLIVINPNKIACGITRPVVNSVGEGRSLKNNKNERKKLISSR